MASDDLASRPLRIPHAQCSYLALLQVDHHLSRGTHPPTRYGLPANSPALLPLSPEDGAEDAFSEWPPYPPLALSYIQSSPVSAPCSYHWLSCASRCFDTNMKAVRPLSAPVLCCYLNAHSRTVSGREALLWWARVPLGLIVRQGSRHQRRQAMHLYLWVMRLF
jgi:hypothetical protein